MTLSQKKHVVAVIPARGGSKGIPKKNIIDLCGKPLIGYSIEAALHTDIVDKILVTTDCDDISRAVNRYAGVTVIRRPEELSQDHSLTVDAILHAMSVYMNTVEEYINENNIDIILLQPTSPLRDASHIREAYELYNQSAVKSLISICREPHNPYKNFILNSKNELSPLFTEAYLSMPRQSLPEVFRQNGAIYIISYQDLKTKKGFYISPSIGYEMSEIFSADIDTIDDLNNARIVIDAQRKKNVAL